MNSATKEVWISQPKPIVNQNLIFGSKKDRAKRINGISWNFDWMCSPMRRRALLVMGRIGREPKHLNEFWSTIFLENNLERRAKEYSALILVFIHLATDSSRPPYQAKGKWLVGRWLYCQIGSNVTAVVARRSTQSLNRLLKLRKNIGMVTFLLNLVGAYIFNHLVVNE